MDPTTKQYLRDLEKQLDEERDNLTCAQDLCDGKWIERIEQRIEKIHADMKYAEDIISKEYKTEKFVCFDCRTTATRPEFYQGPDPKCVECLLPMKSMGFDFKRPKKKDKKAWKDAEKSYKRLPNEGNRYIW